MLLRHRPPGIDPAPVRLSQGFEHLEQRQIAVIRWLNANMVDYVIVGPVAHALRGDVDAKGAVAIVPAPYGRNLERLSRALGSAHARVRIDGSPRAANGEPDTVSVSMSIEKLARGLRWTLRCGMYDLDIEGRPPGVPRYQELLYEAGRFDPAPGVSIEVASPEDLEHYTQVRRTGTSAEIRITRKANAEHKPA